MEWIIEALFINNTLKKIHVSCCDLTKEEGGKIGKMLLKNEPLEVLNMEENNVEEEILNIFEEFEKKHPKF